MTEPQDAELDAALERVFEAARAHLTAVRGAAGQIDDDGVWQAYVALNNASFEYDDRLLEAFDEVTPWEVKPIDPNEADEEFGVGLGGVDGAEPTDPHAQVLSVRQRRDYRVPSVAALLRVADAARRAAAEVDDEPAEDSISTVGEAVLELLQSGDGSLGMLDIPELEPLDGLVTVSEVRTPLDLEAFVEDDGNGPFHARPDDRLLGRLDEHPFVALDGSDQAGGATVNGAEPDDHRA